MYMEFFIDTFCQFCKRFITKVEWIEHHYSSRNLHRDVNGYWTSYFPQRKLTGDEGSRLEIAFWERVSGTVDVLPV